MGKTRRDGPAAPPPLYVLIPSGGARHEKAAETCSSSSVWKAPEAIRAA